MVSQVTPPLPSGTIVGQPASDECWRPVPGCEGYYSVSNFGRVRSEPIQTSPVGRQRGRILRCVPDSKGYPFFVAYMPDGRHASFKVHRAVALAFLGPRPPGHQINHKSGDKRDNAVTNLEYVTCAENIRHGWRMGLFDPANRRGENSATAKLTAEQVCQIRILGTTTSLGILSRQFGVTKQAISAILRRKTWQHLN